MSTSYTQYLVPCLTESLGVVSGFVNTVPTACPNNNTHTIDPSGIRVITSMDSKTVVIKQTSNAVIGDNYRAEAYTMVAAPSTTTTMDISYPYNTTIFLATYLGTPDNIGDSLSVIAAPDNPIGLLAADISSGVTTLTVWPLGLVPNVGWLLSITDGVNTDDLGHIISINPTNGVIVFETATVNGYLTGSTVRISVQLSLIHI